MSVKEELKWLTSISLLSWLFSSVHFNFLYVPKKVCMCDSVVVVRIRAAGGCGVEGGGGAPFGCCCEKKNGDVGSYVPVEKTQTFYNFSCFMFFFF